MVLASRPVASVMRLAARPGGAHSRSRTPFAPRIRRIPLTMVVLPTPGPPVITRVFDIRASLMAATWLSAKTSRIRSSTHGQGLVWIDPRPRELTVGELNQTLSNDTLGTVQTCKNYTARVPAVTHDDRPR